jgi:DNA-binding response OmpR family regulator
MRLRLRANNYEVATARDGYGAIASAKKDRPAFIILDLGLSVGDGFVVLGTAAEQRYARGCSGYRPKGARSPE